MDLLQVLGNFWISEKEVRIVHIFFLHTCEVKKAGCFTTFNYISFSVFPYLPEYFFDTSQAGEILILWI